MSILKDAAGYMCTAGDERCACVYGAFGSFAQAGGLDKIGVPSERTTLRRNGR